MNTNLTTLFKKYSAPIIFIFLGITLLGVGKANNQSSSFMIASALLLVAGFVMLFFSSGSKIVKIASVIGLVVGISSIGILYAVTDDVLTIKNSREYDEEIDELTKQNLMDIKAAQIAYKDANGTYAKTADELKNFVLNGKVKTVVKKGGIPSRRLTPEERAIIYGAGDNRALDYNMSEEEAVILSKSSNPPADLKEFVRDTLSESFFTKTFESKSYLSRRKKMGFPDFNADSIFYIPDSGIKFKMTVKDSVEYQGAKIQTLLVEGTRKMKSKDAETLYSFGSTSSPALSSNWD